jgi:hypothetical protein
MSRLTARCGCTFVLRFYVRAPMRGPRYACPTVVWCPLSLNSACGRSRSLRLIRSRRMYTRARSPHHPPSPDTATHTDNDTPASGSSSSSWDDSKVVALQLIGVIMSDFLMSKITHCLCSHIRATILWPKIGHPRPISERACLVSLERAWFTVCWISGMGELVTAMAIMLARNPVRLAPREGYAILSLLAWCWNPVRVNDVALAVFVVDVFVVDIVLLQHGYHVFGCVHHIDMCLTFLLYQYRSCESEANAIMERVE